MLSAEHCLLECSWMNVALKDCWMVELGFDLSATELILKISSCTTLVPAPPCQPFKPLGVCSCPPASTVIYANTAGTAHRSYRKPFVPAAYSRLLQIQRVAHTMAPPRKQPPPSNSLLLFVSCFASLGVFRESRRSSCSTGQAPVE